MLLTDSSVTTTVDDRASRPLLAANTSTIGGSFA